MSWVPPSLTCSLQNEWDKGEARVALRVLEQALLARDFLAQSNDRVVAHFLGLIPSADKRDSLVFNLLLERASCCVET